MCALFILSLRRPASYKRTLPTASLAQTAFVLANVSPVCVFHRGAGDASAQTLASHNAPRNRSFLDIASPQTAAAQKKLSVESGIVRDSTVCV